MCRISSTDSEKIVKVDVKPQIETPCEEPLVKELVDASKREEIPSTVSKE